MKAGRHKKKSPLCKPARGPPSSGNTTKASFARVVEIEDDSDNEDTYTDEDSISEPDSEPNELNISDLAARTARFSDDQRDEWVTEMKKLGVDF